MQWSRNVSELDPTRLVNPVECAVACHAFPDFEL